MLIQRKHSQNRKIILWGATIILVAIAVLLVYQNISTDTVPVDTANTDLRQRLAVPNDFGEELFSDPRFNEISNEKQIGQRVDGYVAAHEVLANSADTLPAPANIEVLNPGYGGALNIFWTPVSDERVTGYAIWRGQTSATTTPNAFVDQTASGYSDTTVANGELYSYRVTAVSYTLSGEQGSVVSEPIAGGGTLLSFSYPDSAEAVRLYQTRDSEEVVIDTLLSRTLQYIDRDGQEGDTYREEIYSSYLESDFSPIASGTAEDITPADPPTDIKIMSGEDGTSVVFSWINPLDADFDYVKIYRSTTQGILGIPVKDERSNLVLEGTSCVEVEQDLQNTGLATTAEGNCFSDEVGIREGETYYYVLVSVDLAGNESSKRIIRAYGNSNPFDL